MLKPLNFESDDIVPIVEKDESVGLKKKSEGEPVELDV